MRRAGRRRVWAALAVAASLHRPAGVWCAAGLEAPRRSRGQPRRSLRAIGRDRRVRGGTDLPRRAWRGPTAAFRPASGVVSLRADGVVAARAESRRSSTRGTRRRSRPRCGCCRAREQSPFLYVDVTNELTDLSGQGLLQALAQIVYTGSELDEVDRVQITVNGDVIVWPKADLESSTEPLSVYDYPSSVRTAQPAYPSLPGA